MYNDDIFIDTMPIDTNIVCKYIQVAMTLFMLIEFQITKRTSVVKK